MANLAGLRVLVVEDEGGVALLIESMLEELGCHVTASVATLAKALSVARADLFDFAILDVNLDGELVFPVAEDPERAANALHLQHGIRSVGVPEAFKEREVLNKPFTIEELNAKLQSMFGKSDRAVLD